MRTWFGYPRTKFPLLVGWSAPASNFHVLSLVGRNDRPTTVLKSFVSPHHGAAYCRVCKGGEKKRLTLETQKRPPCAPTFSALFRHPSPQPPRGVLILSAHNPLPLSIYQFFGQTVFGAQTQQIGKRNHESYAVAGSTSDDEAKGKNQAWVPQVGKPHIAFAFTYVRCGYKSILLSKPKKFCRLINKNSCSSCHRCFYR